jgi:hypothetical protein
LLAPVEGRKWEILWSSEDPKYGGGGTAPLGTEENWILPGNAAVLLKAKNEEENEKIVRKITWDREDAATAEKCLQVNGWLLMDSGVMLQVQ